MFQTVVWATDGSEPADRALSCAKGLAAGPDRRLVAVHAKEELTGRAAGYRALADDEDLEVKIRYQVDGARAQGFDATFVVVAGAGDSAAHLIADAAADAAADVIVVGTRGRGAIAGVLLGSVTQKLLRIAPCPVLAVPDRGRLEAPRHQQEVVLEGLVR
jgi:nucleotide-binding universal stress UspA family protein